MKTRLSTLLFLTLAISTPCFAGGIKGNLIDDETIYFIIFLIIMIHILAIAAYFLRVNWLRYICAVLYLPIFVIPLVLTLLHGAFILSFIPPGAFYILLIARRRK